MSDWQTIDEISARVAWGRIPARTRVHALEHAVTHVDLQPVEIRQGAEGSEYSLEAAKVIILCLRGRGLQVDGRMATVGERAAWEQLHGKAG